MKHRANAYAGRAAGALCVALACALPPAAAGAVDRSLGADVARPALDGVAWTTGDTARLGRDVDALLAAAPTLRGAHVGMLAVDTRSGNVLYARNVDDAFTPASTMKLLTGSVALALLGPAYRFRTEAYLAPSGIDGDSLTQTLYLRAGGDPLLGADDVRALGHAAFATGAFRFPYPTLVDASAFEWAPYPPGWSWDDFGYDYAAQLTPVPVDENAMQLTVAPGGKAGDPLAVRVSASGFGLPSEICRDARVSPIEPFATTGLPNTASALAVTRNPPQGCLQVTGSLSLGAEPQTLDVAIPEPTNHLFALIRSQLPAPGLPSAGAVPDEGLYRSYPLPPHARLVWSHDGEALADLLADMWWPSDNFVAEMLLRAIGLQQSGMPGTTAHGADAERAWLTHIGVDPAGVTIADGSGLSIYDRLTPRALVAILQADWNGPYREVVLDDLPLAGVRGTLDRSFAGTLAERRTYAKTGSVSHARGLAGYLATLHHGAVTFAWSLDDWMGDNDDLGALRARVLARIIGD